MFTAIDPKYAKTTLAIAAMCVVSAIVMQLFSVFLLEPGVAVDWLRLVSGVLSGVCLFNLYVLTVLAMLHWYEVTLVDGSSQTMENGTPQHAA